MVVSQPQHTHTHTVNAASWTLLGGTGAGEKSCGNGDSSHKSTITFQLPEVGNIIFNSFMTQQLANNEQWPPTTINKLRHNNREQSPTIGKSETTTITNNHQLSEKVRQQQSATITNNHQQSEKVRQQQSPTISNNHQQSEKVRQQQSATIANNHQQSTKLGEKKSTVN